MVFLVSKKHEPVLDRCLTRYQYHKTGDGCYVRQKYTDRNFPIYRLIVNPDNMNHNLLFTLTIETVSGQRKIKDERIIVHKGTAIQEEFAKITQQLSN